MCRVYPELRAYRISHSWMGTVAYTFDELARRARAKGYKWADLSLTSADNPYTPTPCRARGRKGL